MRKRDAARRTEVLRSQLNRLAAASLLVGEMADAMPSTAKDMRREVRETLAEVMDELRTEAARLEA